LPIPQSQLNAERLAEAIKKAVTDSDMHQRAAALGETIRAEDGTALVLAQVVEEVKF
jgi:UDP:flavonoid glycosyltransferase YjiC (YdhE family)